MIASADDDIDSVNTSPESPFYFLTGRRSSVSRLSVAEIYISELLAR